MTYQPCNCEGFYRMMMDGTFKVVGMVDIMMEVHYVPMLRSGGEWHTINWCPFCGKSLEGREGI